MLPSVGFSSFALATFGIAQKLIRMAESDIRIGNLYAPPIRPDTRSVNKNIQMET